MVDIHTHILPGIDDGARDIYDTLEMARIAVESGTTDMVATPHCNIPGRYRNYFGEEYKEVFLKAREAIEAEGIPLRLHPGMEVYMTEEVPKLMAEGKIMPINGSHYVLMEFGFDEDPEFADMMLKKVHKMQVIPLVAHVERYFFVQDDPEIISEWKRRGYAIQCNKGSFQGKFGRKEKRIAHDLLDRQLVSVIASDAHRPNIRSPRMEDAYEELAMEYPMEYLDQVFEVFPRRICQDKSIILKNR